MIDHVESCSCGANIQLRAYSEYALKDSIDLWRKDHRHEFRPNPYAYPTGMIGGLTPEESDDN